MLRHCIAAVVTAHNTTESHAAPSPGGGVVSIADNLEAIPHSSIQSSWSRTGFLGWICTTQILHNISYRQFKSQDDLDYLSADDLSVHDLSVHDLSDV